MVHCLTCTACRGSAALSEAPRTRRRTRQQSLSFSSSLTYGDAIQAYVIRHTCAVARYLWQTNQLYDSSPTSHRIIYALWSTPPTQRRGRAVAHADSSRPVIAEARVRCQAIVLNVCGRSSDIWTRLSPST